MDVDDILVSILANLARTLLVRRFMMTFLTREEICRRVEWLAYSLFYLLTLLLFLAFNIPAVNLASNIIGMSAVAVIYRGSIRKKIFVVAAVYGFNMACDMIAGFSVSNYIMGGHNSQIFQIFAALLLLLCQLGVERLAIKRGNAELSAKCWWLLFMVPLVSIIYLCIMLYSSLGDRFFMVSGSIGILTINLAVFYLYNELMDSHQAIMDRKALEKQVEIYSSQLEIISHTQDSIRSLQHDMKYHIAELRALIKSGGMEDVIAYLGRMENWAAVTGETVFTGNSGADGVLNYLVQRAKKVLKEVNIKISIPADMGFPAFDLNIILGNLLENAIEAAQKSEKQILDFSMEVDKGILFIHVSNSYAGEIKTEGSRILTTKERGGNHGIGLENVKRIVEDYDGKMWVDYKNNFFEVDIMLYKNDKVKG